MQLFSALSNLFWGLNIWDFTAVAKERKKLAKGAYLLSYFAACGSVI